MADWPSGIHSPTGPWGERHYHPEPPLPHVLTTHTHHTHTGTTRNGVRTLQRYTKRKRTINSRTSINKCTSPPMSCPVSAAAVADCYHRVWTNHGQICEVHRVILLLTHTRPLALAPTGCPAAGTRVFNTKDVRSATTGGALGAFGLGNSWQHSTDRRRRRRRIIRMM